MATPQPTLFDRVDSAWISLWEGLGAPGASIGTHAEAWIQYAHHMSGWTWAGVFFGGGVCVRLATLVPSLYGERAIARIATCMHILRPHYQELLKLQSHDKVSEMEKAYARRAFTERRQVVFRKAKTSNMAACAGVLSIPIAVSGLTAFGRVAQSDPSVQKEAFMWVSSLALQDPTWALPIAAEVLTLLNINIALTQRQGFTYQKNTVIDKYRIAAAVVAVGAAPWVATLPAAIVLYWLGIAGTSLLQPLLTRTEWTRQLMGFPTKEDELRLTPEDAEVEAKAQEEGIAFAMNPPSLIRDYQEATRETRHHSYQQVKQAMETEMSIQIEKNLKRVKFWEKKK